MHASDPLIEFHLFIQGIDLSKQERSTIERLLMHVLLHYKIPLPRSDGSDHGIATEE
ncbi:hypothetical protein [Aeromonas simiae]|uniref:hypothetical protein n=1 Tax=Aeromonas simiae TaxID=218936 RepID=UPI00266CE1F5|nr:hypothetical protein [Aeromonas simiae]MDO2950528.1 hypothetical protein [Aeromonas simiae]